VDWPLLADLPAEEVRHLVQIARRRTFSAAEVVFHEGDPADSMHLIVKGRYAIRVTSPLGDTVIITVRGPGEVFGEMALVSDDAHRSATVAALEAGETYAVHRPDFERLRDQYPSVDRVLIGLLAADVRRMNMRLLEALYTPVERRVRRRLLELVDTYKDGGGVVPLTQEQLAELAGTSRTTVNRVLREEQERGTVSLQRRATIVLDPEGLAGRAR
jgi:CRP/FNR family transcriptional regulator, cyclic AMP receptor protein